MTVIGRVLVREASGIRRFFYPLSIEALVPEARLDSSLGLVRKDGEMVPLQVTKSDHSAPGCRLDLAVSLAPREEVELLLCTGQKEIAIQDPLHIRPGTSLRSEQQRFAIELDRDGAVREVVYDGVHYLRAPHKLRRNGVSADPGDSALIGAGLPLAARVLASCRYADGCRALTRAEITAYKSWLMLSHTLEAPCAGDIVEFHLPLAATASLQTCDFGAGGGIYGKLQAGVVPEIVWKADFTSEPPEWSLLVGGCQDYIGTTPRGELRSQCWFHWVDSDKALAAAITRIPEDCRTLTVTLGSSGDVAIAFELGEILHGPACFGVCHHFLNAIPALSAATNPQSILLPPQVGFHR
jgi:hypothetical protein